MAPQADMFDMIKAIVRETIKEELGFEVERCKHDDDSPYFTVYLTMDGVRTDKYICLELSEGQLHGHTDYCLEVI